MHRHQQRTSHCLQSQPPCPTRGVMRKIDTVATQCLIEGMATKGTVVDAATVARAIEVCQEVLR